MATDYPEVLVELGQIPGSGPDQSLVGIGARGAQGEQGDPGPKGTQGEKGTHGDQGIQGVRGDAGPVGHVGSRGIPGIQGVKGADGLGLQLHGSVASRSDLPADGKSPGETYLIRDTGHAWLWTGTVWADGGQLQGVRGSDGAKGDPGQDSTAPGPAGQDGGQGVQGIPGTRGDKGDKGERGDRGERGVDGADATTSSDYIELAGRVHTARADLNALMIQTWSATVSYQDGQEVMAADGPGGPANSYWVASGVPGVGVAPFALKGKTPGWFLVTARSDREVAKKSLDSLVGNPSTWRANAPYSLGDVVVDLAAPAGTDNVFVAQQAVLHGPPGTPPLSPPHRDIVHWYPATSLGQIIGEWPLTQVRAGTIDTQVADIGRRMGEQEVISRDLIGGAPARYSGAITYNIGDVVEIGGRIFVSIKDGLHGEVPGGGHSEDWIKVSAPETAVKLAQLISETEKMMHLSGVLPTMPLTVTALRHMKWGATYVLPTIEKETVPGSGTMHAVANLGIVGVRDRGHDVINAIIIRTGVQVWTLYGEEWTGTAMQPSIAWIANIDPAWPDHTGVGASPGTSFSNLIFDLRHEIGDSTVFGADTIVSKIQSLETALYAASKRVGALEAAGGGSHAHTEVTADFTLGVSNQGAHYAIILDDPSHVDHIGVNLLDEDPHKVKIAWATHFDPTHVVDGTSVTDWMKTPPSVWLQSGSTFKQIVDPVTNIVITFSALKTFITGNSIITLRWDGVRQRFEIDKVEHGS